MLMMIFGDCFKYITSSGLAGYQQWTTMAIEFFSTWGRHQICSPGLSHDLFRVAGTLIDRISNAACLSCSRQFWQSRANLLAGPRG